jgi:multidrug transporter EmrE-like cation transporter
MLYPLIGVGLVVVAMLFGEVAADIGKIEVRKKEESIYTMAFLNIALGTIIFIVIGIFRSKMHFNPAALPGIIMRSAFDMVLIYLNSLLIVKASRSTVGFLHVGTIPLLLIVDAILGFKIETLQLVGIGVIVTTIILLATHHGLDKKGLKIGIFTALIPVVTITIYRYNIENFHSVEIEQAISHGLLMIQLFVMAHFIAKENPFKFFRKKIFIAESVFNGVASVLSSFAYIYAPPSVITAAKRSAGVLWTTVSGSLYFHEKHIALKVAAMMLIIVGLVLLVM